MVEGTVERRRTRSRESASESATMIIRIDDVIASN